VFPQHSPPTTFNLLGITYEEDYPRGIYDMALIAKGWGLPIYITENGVPDGDKAGSYMVRHLGWLERAQTAGDTEALDLTRDAVQNHGDDFYAAASEVIDMDEFLDFWALSVAIGNRDGYPFNLNDYFVYRDPADGRFRYSPWGMDESWDTASPAYWYSVGGDVAEQCLYYDATCGGRYMSAQAEAIDFYETEDLTAFADACFALTETAMMDDTRKNWAGYAWTTGDVLRYRDLLAYRVEMYPVWLRTRMGL
jgi:hypothetical protein